jgi:hypothetical protein
MTYFNIYGFKYKNRLRFILVRGHSLFDYPMAQAEYAYNRMKDLFTLYSYDEVCNLLDNPTVSVSSQNILDDANIYKEIEAFYNNSLNKIQMKQICKFSDAFDITSKNYCDNCSFKHLNQNDITCENLLNYDKMLMWYRTIKGFQLSSGIMSAAIINLDDKLLEHHCSNDYLDNIINDELTNKYSSFEKFKSYPLVFTK